MILTPKQTLAIDILEDSHTTELYYGGAAGGGKSALGCYWQLKRRLQFPGTRGLLGRSVLKTLKETTLATFFDVAKMQGVIRGVHFDLTSAQHSEMPNCLVFENGGIIYLKDLYANPNDPDFDELGSLEITDAFLDESPQITVKAKNVVRSRIRYQLTENNLIPKMLMSGNPSKNWAYAEFYKPSKEGTIRADRRFVQALPGDNENLPKSYIKSLEGLDKNSRERLLYGNWEYDDDPSALMPYDKIIDIFSNKHVEPGDKKITCDVARLGGDRIVIIEWNGFRGKVRWYKKQSLDQTARLIEISRNEMGIGLSDILVDEDGVGGGIVDFYKCKGFVNNSRALPSPDGEGDLKGKPKPENFDNLKSQCYFRLADRINKNNLFIDCDDMEIRQLITEELEQVKQKALDSDLKKGVIPKDKMKELLGRSPDFADTLMMREYFELIPKLTWVAF